MENLRKIYPAFFYSLFLLIGIAFYIHFSWAYLAPLAFLLKKSPKKSFVISCLITLFGFFYTQNMYNFPQIERVSGEGIFHTQTLSIKASPFGKSYVYQGYLTSFSSKNQVWKNIACSFYTSLDKPRPNCASLLKLSGDLLCKENKSYIFKPSTISVLEKGFSFAEIRFLAKQKFFLFLKKHVQNREVCSFLNSMLTGDIEERVLNLEFNKLGLQHILGVSGFQFVLLAGLIGFILSLFLPYKIALLTLLFSLTSYFFFLGDSPPVQRAWISISIVLIGKLLERKITSLNALGVALGVGLLIDPLVLKHIGFQLSFLSTFAILTLYPKMRALIATFLPKRSFRERLLLSPMNLSFFFLLHFIKESFAINFAVHLATIPALLTLFGKFPLLSFFYNLFFPLGATIVFLGSLAAIFFTILLPPIGVWLHHYNTEITAFLLNLSSNSPSFLDFSLQIHNFFLEWTVLILTGVGVWIFSDKWDKKLS